MYIELKLNLFYSSVLYMYGELCDQNYFIDIFKVKLRKREYFNILIIAQKIV